MSEKPRVPIEPVKGRQPLHAIVQQKIKDHIIQNALRPGDQLPPETELTRLLGVSRNSVREAIKGLEMLDIVETRSGAGLFVGNFSFDALLDNFGYGVLFNLMELDDILEVRFHVEYGMIPRAVEAVTAEQIERLRDVLQQMHAAAQAGTYSAENDRLFHQVFWSNVRNKVLGKILDVFWGIYYQARRRTPIPEPVDLMETYERHVKILKALEDRDVKALQESMIFHYEGIKNRLVSIQEAQEADET